MTSMATTAVFVTGGVDTHGHTHHAAVLDSGASSVTESSRPHQRGIEPCCSGSVAMAFLTGSASRGPAPTGSASHGTSGRPECRWWRWTDPIGGPGERKESLIHWMLTRRPGRRYRVVHRSCRRCATARWRQSEPSGWPAPALSKLAPKPLTSSSSLPFWPSKYMAGAFDVVS
jgi:hypothetical protein